MVSLVGFFFHFLFKRFIFYFILHAINHGIPYPYFPPHDLYPLFFFVVPIILSYKVDSPWCSGSLPIGLQSLIKPFPSCSISSFFRIRQAGAEGIGAPRHHHQGREREFPGSAFFLPFSLFPFCVFAFFHFSLEWDGSESVHLFRWLMVVGGGHGVRAAFFLRATFFFFPPFSCSFHLSF